MRLTIAYSKIKKRNLVLINNATYQRETLSEQPIRQPLNVTIQNYHKKLPNEIPTFGSDYKRLSTGIFF